MSGSGFDEDVLDKLRSLQEKYAATGQNMVSYLEGLLHGNFLKYWDYIHLDTLLSLQNPRTDFPDEEIFIIYHQITELHFKLIINELKEIHRPTQPKKPGILKRVVRCNRYFMFLADSFAVMSEGMEKEQFQKFRMSLLPASGFQSVQFRIIELMSTPLLHLIEKDKRDAMAGESIDKQFEHIYWKQGATELVSGTKTLTLRLFEEKYQPELVDMAHSLNGKDLYTICKENNYFDDEEVVKALRLYDEQLNIHWRLAHLRSTVRYLQQKPENIAATGGTNWQKYLPPSFQQVIFFPELWTEHEQNEWGKALFRKN
jgi:tryptophan 2,3-dioxygenase